VVAHPLKDFIVKFKAGESIYKQEDPGAEMFIVQSGSVRIFRGAPGSERELSVMEKGDFFGEMSVLEGTPRTASAQAVEDCELIEINSTVFDRMIRGNIEIAVRMLRKLSSRLQETTRRLETLGAPQEAAREAALPDPDRPSKPAPPSLEEAPSPGAAEGQDQVVPFGPDWLGALILTEGSQVFPIRGENSLIGRYDPVTGTRPEIDLTAHDTNRSVSRRHAKVTVRDGGLFVSEEVGALNGTFLNGKRLTPGKSEPIRSGDTLALGMVTLRFQGKERGA
jgi:cyclic nucleotide-binding protein/FHA domain-containing protein